MKPWELEAMQTERYQSSTADEPYRPHMQPTTAPKPRIVQISAQSSAGPPPEQNSPSAGYRSVSPTVPPKPYRPQAPPPTASQYQYPSPQHLSPNVAHNDVSGGHGAAPNIVHLQYNTPIGLYSNANVMDTYVGQTQGQALSPS